MSILTWKARLQEIFLFDVRDFSFQVSEICLLVFQRFVSCFFRESSLVFSENRLLFFQRIVSCFFRESSLTHFRDSFFRKRKALFFHVEAIVLPCGGCCSSMWRLLFLKTGNLSLERSYITLAALHHKVVGYGVGLSVFLDLSLS